MCSISKKHFEYVEQFKFFGITPEYMALQLSRSSHAHVLNSTVVNHIVLCAYIENIMAPEKVRLIEKYGIMNFTRYPVEIMESMVSEYAETGEKKPKVAVVLVAKTDWNSALDDIKRPMRSLYAQHRTYIYEVGSKADFYRAIREIGEECEKRGEKINTVCFDGHGHEKVIQFGYPYTHTKTELPSSSVSFFAPLQRYLTEDAQMVFASCSAGKGGKDEENIARQFAQTWSGVEVFAANRMTSTKDIRTDSSGRVTDVEYSDDGAAEVIKIP